MPSYSYHCWDVVGHLFQNCRFKKCCLCTYKSRLYRLDGQQNRLDLYHRSASTRFYENRLELCLDHPRWRKSSWFVPHSTCFCQKKVNICLLMFQLLNLNGDHHCTHCMSLNFNPHILSQYYESQSGLTQCWPIRCKYFNNVIKCLMYSY